jgi:hypothetical protein
MNQLEVSEVLDRGRCPFCGRQWFRARVKRPAGVMVMHDAPACDHFRRHTAEEFYRIVTEPPS